MTKNKNKTTYFGFKRSLLISRAGKKAASKNGAGCADRSRICLKIVTYCSCFIHSQSLFNEFDLKNRNLWYTHERTRNGPQEPTHLESKRELIRKSTDSRKDTQGRFTYVKAVITTRYDIIDPLTSITIF